MAKIGAFVVLTALVGPESACDCPPTVTPVNDGDSVAGIVPSKVVAPWLGDHQGQLTWLFNGHTTALHFDIEQQGPIEAATAECGIFSNNTPDFQADLTAHVTTDDGTIDAKSGATLDFGPDGHVGDQSFIVSPSLTPAQTATTGTGDSLQFTINAHDGKLQGTTVGEWLGGDGTTPVARIDFGP